MQYSAPILAATAAASLSLATPAAASPLDSAHPIVGGEADTADPAVAFITIELDNGEVWWCSGTLISPTVVLTAAHCVDMPGVVRIETYFGSTYRDEEDPYFVERIAAIDHAFMPDWSLHRGDIALVRLERAAATAPVAINRTPLPESYAGGPIRAVGWGKTGENERDAGIKRAVVTEIRALSNPYHLTYGTQTTNICSGDSGGPAFVEVDGAEVLAGINSFGYGTTCRSTSGATRVAAFIDWIDAWLYRWSNEPASIAEGDACRTHVDCASGFCPVIDGVATCRAQCDLDADACGEGTTCTPVTQDVGACLPAIEDSAAGCSGTDTPGGVVVALVLLLLPAWRRRHTSGEAP